METPFRVVDRRMYVVCVKELGSGIYRNGLELCVYETPILDDTEAANSDNETIRLMEKNGNRFGVEEGRFD